MKFVCVGDLGVDHYEKQDRTLPGGCSLNVAVNLRRLLPSEHSVCVVSAIANDHFSQSVLETIQKENLLSVLVPISGRTPYSRIQLQPNGDRVFASYDPGVLQEFRLEGKAAQTLSEADWVMSLIFSQVEEFFHSVIQTPRRGKLSIDFMDMQDYGKSPAIVEKYVDHIDLGFFGLDPRDDQLIRRLSELAEAKNRIFVITLGEAGSLVFEGATYYEAQAYPVQAVDTTGAGDSFSASFVQNYSQGAGIQTSIEQAHRHAAKIVQRLGSF